MADEALAGTARSVAREEAREGAPGPEPVRAAPREGGREGGREAGRDAAREPARDGDGSVTYEALQDLLRAERRSNKLMPLPPRFWSQVREFLQARTDAFRLEQARDPFGRPVMRLTDEVKNARHAAEGVWALRERKLAMLALAATGARKPPEGITPDEADLYRRLMDGLDESRGRVFGGILPTPAPAGAVQAAGPAAAPVQPLQMPIAGPASMALRDAPAATPAPLAPGIGAAAAPSAAAPLTIHAVPADTKAADPVVTIRALGDIPPFVGPDMQTYLLKAGDIATVPPSIANLLVRRGKAAVVDA